MPISESEMLYAEMRKLVRDGHTCGQCGGRLDVAWRGKSYILRCGNDINHNTINRHDKEREEQIRQIKEIRGMDSKALQVMPEAMMLQRIDMARFPQELTVADKRLLAKVAITYGFDPLMKEVTIYQGNPYVSIDGRYRKAQETGRLDGVQTRPATKAEKVEWEIPDGDYFYRAEVFVKGASHPFVGWGRVFKSETVGGKGFKPVEKNPQRMAEKRAEAQGLRKAFHIPLPSTEDIGVEEEEARPLPPGVIEATGEIVEEKTPETVIEAKPMTGMVKGKEFFSAPAYKSEPAKPPDPPQEAPESTRVGFIDTEWLTASMKKMKWSEKTLMSWIKSKVKGLDCSGKLSDVLARMTKEQAEVFTKELQSVVDLK